MNPDQSFAEEIKKATDQAYNMGYDAACKNITEAIGLLPVQTISLEHMVRLIQIVKRVSKEKQ